VDPGDRRGAHGTFPYPSRDGGKEKMWTKCNQRYICHREAFFPRQRDFDTPDTVYHQRGG